MKIKLTPFPVIIMDVSRIPGCDACVGRSMGPFVLLQKTNPFYDGTLAHEVEHVRQWSMWAVPLGILSWLAWSEACPYWMGIAIASVIAHGVAKKLSNKYAIWAELRGAVAKLEAEGWLETLVQAESYDLANAYGFGMTVDEAFNMIMNERDA